MSIIEKAAGKLAQNKPAGTPAPQAQPAPVAGTTPDQVIHASTAAVAPPPAPAETPRATSKRLELNLDRLHKAGMVTPDGGRSGVAEEFRAIKRTLLQNVQDGRGAGNRPSNLIMVTSALPGEGKTFCSINLAISMAMELDHTVLLVDADVARPSVLKRLGVDSQPGLMDVLLDEGTDISDVMLKTNIDTLSILPAGRSHRHATELLASQSMNKLMIEIANRYKDRIVIFDSPPLLVTTESRALATRMGQIVMVVEGERTTQNTLRTALRHIDGCPNINLIYNKAKAFKGLENYGYYYE